MNVLYTNVQQNRGRRVESANSKFFEENFTSVFNLQLLLKGLFGMGTLADEFLNVSNRKFVMQSNAADAS